MKFNKNSCSSRVKKVQLNWIQTDYQLNWLRIITCQHSEPTNLWFSLIQTNKGKQTYPKCIGWSILLLPLARGVSSKTEKRRNINPSFFAINVEPKREKRQIYRSTFFLHPSRVIFVWKKNLFSFNIIQSRSLNFWVPRNDFPNIL